MVGVLRLEMAALVLSLHPHVCLIVAAVKVETEVWQRTNWVI